MRLNQVFIAFFLKAFSVTVVVITLFLGFSSNLIAQRPQQINCTVSLDKTNLNATNVDFINDLGRQIEAYINEYDWDQDITFEEYEVIKMNMRIILLSVDSNNNFQANVLVSISRPIYNTLSETVLINYLDNQWNFNFTPNTAFIHDERVFNSITSVADFYALVAMGMDADSFGERKGQPYFQRALNVAILAESAGSSGWNSSDRNSRRSFVRNILNPTFDGFRVAFYNYYYKGLDHFTLDPIRARQSVMEALNQLLEARRNNSELLLFDSFFATKYTELVSVFLDADTQVRLEAYNLLVELDNSHISEYDKLQ
jgi:hypothetical protein